MLLTRAPTRAGAWQAREGAAAYERAAFEMAFREAKALDPDFEVRMPEGWLD